MSNTRLEPRDAATLVLFSLVLFGAGLLSGGELSLAEAIVPQTARTMLDDGDWLVPKRGAGPWLEGAPLAQWLTAWWGAWFDGLNPTGMARIPAVCLSIGTVLITAHLAARWFGRADGMLSGLMLATSAQFANQAWRANEFALLTFLNTATLALFAGEESARDAEASSFRRGAWPEFLRGRTLRMCGLFVLWGATNLSGPLGFGPLCASVPMIGFLLWNWNAPRCGRYLWLWGWVIAALIGLSWPLLIILQVPQAVEFWTFDWQVRWAGDDAGLSGSIARPIWFYAAVLPWLMAPWSLVIPAGLWTTRHESLAEKYSPQRFVWCWAMMWPLVISLAPGKHPQYLLPCLPAWSMLGSLGLRWLRDRVAEWPDFALRPGVLGTMLVLPFAGWLWLMRIAAGGWGRVPYWLCLCPLAVGICAWLLRGRNFRRVAHGIFAALAVIHGVRFWETGSHRETPLRSDAAFLRQVRDVVPASASLLVDLSVGGTRGVWVQWQLGARAMPLQNLTFLVAADRPGRDFFVVTDGTSRAILDRQGIVTPVLGSRANEGASLMLYRVTLHEDLLRVTASTPRISPQQAKFPALGPFLDSGDRIGEWPHDPPQ